MPPPGSTSTRVEEEGGDMEPLSQLEVWYTQKYKKLRRIWGNQTGEESGGRKNHYLRSL